MVYDKAYELARAIRNSEEYSALKEAQKKVEADGKAKDMLEDFRRRQIDLQVRQLQGETVSEEEKERLQKLFETLNLHGDIRKLFEAERRFNTMMEDIQKIIAEPLKDIFGGKER
ncbi:YlbF family regulator [Bacillaceae bacterium]